MRFVEYDRITINSSRILNDFFDIYGYFENDG